MPFEAVKFDYASIDEWRGYFGELKELAKSCKAIIEFWNELRRKCNGLTFKDLLEDWNGYDKVLLGGVDSNGQYKDRSLAKVYAVLFGFKPENVRDLIERLKMNIPPITKIVVEETRFIRFVNDVFNKVTAILRQAESKGLINNSEVDVTVDYYGILSDYSKLIEILSNFINNVANILPNHNQKSLFVWTLDKLTYRYMTTAYPKLKDDKTFDMVKETLGLEVIFSPDVEDDNVKRDYEIYSYHDGSLGRELIWLYKIIWEAFNGDWDTVKADLSIVSPEIPNFKKEFYMMVKDVLRSMGWKFPDIQVAGKDYHYPDTKGDTFRAEYKISGIILTSCYIDRCSTTGNYSSYTFECNIPLLKLLDDLAPGVFLLNGLLFDLTISKDVFEIRTPSIRAVSAWKYEYFDDDRWLLGIVR